jgi:TonB family protein
MRSWVEGQFFVICNGVTTQQEPVDEYWVRIRTAAGLQAWTNVAGKAFVSEEGLNSELGEKIADDKLALSEKLAQIDTLLKGGANLNGSGGKYGTDPMWAAIRSTDADLLRALISKGLNIQKSQPCSAYPVTQSTALLPGGDVWLEFLLENGLRLDCLGEPPLQAFLGFGIATDNYPVDQAIRVAEVLINHGANVNQRDSQGKSIFDVLDQAKEPSRLIALRDALVNLAKHEMILGVKPEQTTQIDSARPSPGSIPDQPISGAGFSGGAYRIGGGVSAPTVIHKVEPEYSEEARQRKFQGTVILFIVVDAEGKPRDLRVIRPLGLGLDQKAIEAVEKWKFKPGMKDGKPVAVQATIEVNFRLL